MIRRKLTLALTAAAATMAFAGSAQAARLTEAVEETEAKGDREVLHETAEKKPSPPSLVMTLLHRSFIKSYRDVVAYGIRFAMYFGKQPRGGGSFALECWVPTANPCVTGLAVMMGTVWLRLSAEQASIIPFTNAICEF